MKKYLSLIVFAGILLAGLLTFDQYGESWDDRSLQKYALLSMQAYTTWPQQGYIEVDPQNLGYYGPFFVTFVSLGSQFLQTFLPFQLPDLRHLLYFLFWFASIIAFYSIAKRWLSQTSALGATLLYITQPLLWGHVFINPKDTPFLALFTISLALGFWMIDATQGIALAQLDSKPKRILTLLTSFWLVSVFPSFAFTEAIHNYIQALVISAQSGGTNIFTFIAKNITGISAEVYTQRYFVLFLQLRSFYFLLLTLILLFVWYRIQPNLIKILLSVLLPAILLGFTTSTRIIGPYAGLIVALYGIRMRGKESMITLSMYAVIAIIVTYLTWPYLWMNPVIRFYGSFVEMSSYPWFGEVLFNGAKYSASDLPLSYLPILFAIQLTEPVWILAFVGLVLAFKDLNQKQGLLLLSLLWFLIPTLSFIFLHITLYDNSRQVLFVLPPVFFLAGVVFEKIKNVKWQIAVIVLSLVPGFIGIFSLHPYEYIYYNSFAGGVGNVQGRFETDYWLTSYREAAEYLNENASPDALIWVEGPGNLYSIFAKNEMNVYSWSREQAPAPYDYAVITTRSDYDKTVYPNAKIIYKIVRENAVLAVIKSLKEKP